MYWWDLMRTCRDVLGLRLLPSSCWCTHWLAASLAQPILPAHRMRMDNGGWPASPRWCLGDVAWTSQPRYGTHLENSPICSSFSWKDHGVWFSYPWCKTRGSHPFNSPGSTRWFWLSWWNPWSRASWRLGWQAAPCRSYCSMCRLGIRFAPKSLIIFMPWKSWIWHFSTFWHCFLSILWGQNCFLFFVVLMFAECRSRGASACKIAWACSHPAIWSRFERLKRWAHGWLGEAGNGAKSIEKQMGFLLATVAFTFHQ